MSKRMFDFDDFYERIARHLPDGCTVAEVGVADGCSALYLAESLVEEGKSFKLYMIDSLAYGGADQLAEIMKHLNKAGFGDLIELLAVDSLNASARFPDNHFDFVFIDASHRYELTKADIRLWYHKIKENAILAGHDYNETPEGVEVKKAVDEVVPRTIIRPPLPDGQVFEEEPVLRTEATSSGWGVWWLKKKFYLQMK